MGHHRQPARDRRRRADEARYGRDEDRDLPVVGPHRVVGPGQQRRWRGSAHHAYGDRHLGRCRNRDAKALPAVRVVGLDLDAGLGGYAEPRGGDRALGDLLPGLWRPTYFATSLQEMSK